MRNINLLPKEKKPDTIKRLTTRLSACNKMIRWHDENIIKIQDDLISHYQALLRLHEKGEIK
jgi:hypothetical protein